MLQRHTINKIVLLIIIQIYGICIHAQNLSENLKVALVYNICKEVRWSNHNSQTFSIGILSNNKSLIDLFTTLAKTTKLQNKTIVPVVFTNEYAIQPTDLIYIDPSYNHVFSLLSNRIAKQNTLVFTEEYPVSSEIMMNIKLDSKTKVYSFEFNRANILFAGLDLTEDIIALKGTEIEIRALYLQAKKLRDKQQQIVDSLKAESDFQHKNISIKNDSIIKMRTAIESNNEKIAQQIKSLAVKDSISQALALQIKMQQAELKENMLRTQKIIDERNLGEATIKRQDSTILQQIALSETLNQSILKKQQELIERTRALYEKDTVIKKQGNWLVVTVSLILIIALVIIIVLRAYLLIKRSKQKIAEQKIALETTLDKLQSTQQQLIQSEKMASLGVFIAGIAHEINNPINFISTGVESIEKALNKVEIMSSELNKVAEESQAPEIKSLIDLKEKIKFNQSMEALPTVLKNIQTGIARTISITTGLKLYARIDKEEKQLYDIHKIIDTAILLIKPQINSQIDIEFNYSNLPHVLVYPGKLSQVIVNVLSNAIDAINATDKTAEKPKIIIKTSEENQTIKIEISDTGCGIPPEILSKLFDPFFTTKPVGKGTGLGMSVSLSIIESHNGKIFAKNNSGKGATFTIEIPTETN